MYTQHSEGPEGDKEMVLGAGRMKQFFIKIRSSVGFATLQTPCHRKADMGRHYFFKISATDDKSFCGSSELPLSWNVKY